MFKRLRKKFFHPTLDEAINVLVQQVLEEPINRQLPVALFQYKNQACVVFKGDSMSPHYCYFCWWHEDQHKYHHKARSAREIEHA